MEPCTDKRVDDNPAVKVTDFENDSLPTVLDTSDVKENSNDSPLEIGKIKSIEEDSQIVSHSPGLNERENLEQIGESPLNEPSRVCDDELDGAMVVNEECSVELPVQRNEDGIEHQVQVHTEQAKELQSSTDEDNQDLRTEVQRKEESIADQQSSMTDKSPPTDSDSRSQSEPANASRTEVNEILEKENVEVRSPSSSPKNTDFVESAESRSDVISDSSEVSRQSSTREPSPNVSNPELLSEQKQIYDETVSSTDNLNEDKPNTSTKQNGNIWDKLTDQFQTSEQPVDKGDNSSQNVNEEVCLEADANPPSQAGTDSEKEVTDDDIINISIDIPESGEDEKADKVSESETNDQSSNVLEVSHPDNDTDSSQSEISSESHGNQCNYLQKMSNVIRAIDSSKSSTAQKKDRDNIFSVFTTGITPENTTESAPVLLDESNDKSEESQLVSESNQNKTLNENDIDNSAPQEKDDVTADDDESSQRNDALTTSSKETTPELQISEPGPSSEESLDSMVTPAVQEPMDVSPSEQENDRSFMQALIPVSQEETVVPVVHVKQEKDVEMASAPEESGDILDILASVNTTPVVPSQPVDSNVASNDNSRTSTPSIVSVVKTFLPPVSIKSEPVDDYTPLSQSSDYPAASSLEQLSRQVSRYAKPKVSNVAKKSTTAGKVNANKRFNPYPEKNFPMQQQSQISRPPFTAAPNTSLLPRGPFALQSRAINPPKQLVTGPVMSTGANLLYPIQIPVHPQTTKQAPVTNPVQTVKVVSNGKTITVPASSIFNISTVVPPKPDSQLKEPTTPLPKSTINIDTVGLVAITELIARKNPIPNYKPPPIPDSLKNIIAEDQCKNICYECGDTFLFQSSLKTHRARTSMIIKYKCQECKQVKNFFNKCQFLGHLRNHLNIDKSQAVPIHIKSDSISITTLDHGPNVNHWLKWIEDIDTNPESLPTKPKECQSGSKVPEKLPVIQPKTDNAANFRKEDGCHRCYECGGFFEDLKKHFGFYSTQVGQYSCTICRNLFPSMCSARAHRRIHECREPYVCPVCGKNFSNIYVDENSDKLTQSEAFAYHTMYECYHNSQQWKLTCPKCSYVSISPYYLDFKYHLREKLEQYYKCQVCPMAFKQTASFLKHFEGHTDHQTCKQSFKVIYRCHLCDSVMDDKSVLDLHILKHCDEMGKNLQVGYLCKLCNHWCKGRTGLKVHLTTKHESVLKEINNKDSILYKCMECDKTKSMESLYELLKHEIQKHSVRNYSVFQNYNSFSVKCKTCGIIMFSKVDVHHCIDPDPVKQRNNSKGKARQCKLCLKVFRTNKFLQNHLSFHQLKGATICIYCQSMFPSLDEVKSHQSLCSSDSGNADSPKVNVRVKKTKTPSIEYPCDVCGFICFNKVDLAKHHKENHNDSSIHSCHLCGLTYDTHDTLRKHIMITHEGKKTILSCHICQKRGIKKVFSTKERLDKHLAVRHKHSKYRNIDSIANDENNTVPSSEKIKKRFHESDGTIPVKKLRVDGDAQFTCAKCTFTSNEKSSFVAHLTEHRIENCVLCLECGLSFAVMPSLRKHLFMVHKIKDFDTYCKENQIEDLPEAKFDDSEIRKGLQVESDQEKEEEEVEGSFNPLECRVCYKVFDNEAAVKSHLRTHGMAFIKNRRSKPSTPGKDSAVSNDETSMSDSSSKT